MITASRNGVDEETGWQQKYDIKRTRIHNPGD